MQLMPWRGVANRCVRARLRVGVRALALVLAAAVPWPADAGPPAWQVVGGDAARGKTLMQPFGCAGCHTIPGVNKATGNVGPPLSRFGDRTYIAGMLANDPLNLIRWLREPQSVVPGNAMPDTGLSPAQARDVAAFLYTLR